MAELNASSLSDLRRLPPWDLMWSQSEDSYDIEFPGYWVDGWVVPEHPARLIQKGHFNVEAVLFGGNSRDGVGTPGAYMPAHDYPNTVAEYDADIAKHWRPRNETGGLQATVRTLSVPCGSEVAAAYPPAKFAALVNGSMMYGNAAAAFKAADGDYNVVCPAREIARQATRNGRRAFLYYFSHGPRLHQPGCGGNPPSAGAPRVVDGWANHGSEQAWVFGEGNISKKCFFEQSEWALSDAIQTYWGNFAKFGDPNGSPESKGRLPRWPHYIAGADGAGPAMQLEVEGDIGGLHVLDSFGAEGSNRTVNCDFWMKLTHGYNDTLDSVHHKSESRWYSSPVRWLQRVQAPLSIFV
eukprot:gnl/TRDRNA2_/TRDRNA2_89182_c1_seq1.p1 gnl/TRDRNA2_/TRDRNA2_89182_c1~~gnl/TRDRNA2_/TRDRNA2_89182_c1_seq1.p1  ORF type:complete len:353 (+),score=42.88 gnl/TRDRNA2_/TRDRNA2_89182_c1_seq1:1-1059(+)